jgi:hypothetical protein
MLTFIDILKALLEVVGLTLLGQGLLFVLAGARRERNVVYQALATVTRPVLRLTRRIAPRLIVDQHVGLLAFLLVALLWLATLVEKQTLCTRDLQHRSCVRLAVDYARRCAGGQESSCEALRRSGLDLPVARAGRDAGQD